jgi:hypothetical protein
MGCWGCMAKPRHGQEAMVRDRRRHVPRPWAHNRDTAAPGLASGAPLPLAKPRSHLAAPWPGPPATWTGLYAFLVKREG